MKFIHFISSAIFFCSSLSNCTSQNDYPKEYGKLKIAWRSSFKSDQLYGSRSPAVFDDKVVFSNYSSFGAENFLALNADTGKEQWVWNDYISTGATHRLSEDLPLVYNNILCIAPGNGLIGVDIETGQTLWKNQFPSLGTSKQFGKYSIREGRDGDTKAFFRLINMENGESRDVFQIDTITTPYFSMYTPDVYKQENGDTLMYFTFGESFQQSNGAVLGYSVFYAYNLTTNTIVWSKKGFGALAIRQNDRLYAMSDKLYCLNPQTGDIIWERAIPEKSGGYFHLYEDKLVITGQGSPTFVHAYNISDGSPAWSIPFSGNTSEPMYYKGLMYFTCGSDGRLWSISVSTGDRIWHERCPDLEDNSDSFWSFGINVDPVRNKLYVASFTGAFCLEPAN